MTSFIGFLRYVQLLPDKNFVPISNSRILQITIAKVEREIAFSKTNLSIRIRNCRTKFEVEKRLVGLHHCIKSFINQLGNCVIANASVASPLTTFCHDLIRDGAPQHPLRGVPKRRQNQPVRILQGSVQVPEDAADVMQIFQR